MRFAIPGLLICLAALQTLAAGADTCTIIPVPQKVEAREGVFKLRPETRILTDAASQETGRYLAGRLGQSTGFKLEVAAGDEKQAAPGSISLTAGEANAGLGAEGYELTVAPESVAIRAADQAGLFYGVQSLLQLLPPQALGSKPTTGVDWQIACVRIEDRPRFKWRGMLLDVSRHFYTKAEVERILDLMALHKLNVFQWHLVDHDGWRIEIKKYPKLTQVGAWRKGIGYGIDPRASTAYGPDGRYGGFYTQEEIREVVQYAKTRHIMVVPEIEMPGHAGAALRAYPEFNCVNATGTGPARQIGVYCVGNDGTFAFLQDVLTEVCGLFPDQYIHIGGDEVDKSNWKQCPKCQARIKQEGLRNENELQSYFIRRIEKFINAQNRTLVGWSEIREGGLAQNAVMMDWIGGAVESATEGHDVVMSPTGYSYFDYYQALDYTLQPTAIGGYVPLSRVYSFEPIPAKLDPKYHSHILGGQANLWTEYIASPKHLDFMIFPRLCAMAEAVWSPKDARNWDDFLRRLQVHRQRLDVLGVDYFADDSVKVGEWTPAQVKTEETTLEWDVSKMMGGAGKCHVLFEYTTGAHAINIAWVALLMDGREIARDTHHGHAGATHDPISCDVVYVLGVPVLKRGTRYTIQARVVGDGGNDSNGVVRIESAMRPTIR